MQLIAHCLVEAAVSFNMAAVFFGTNSVDNVKTMPLFPFVSDYIYSLLLICDGCYTIYNMIFDNDYISAYYSLI